MSRPGQVPGGYPGTPQGEPVYQGPTGAQFMLGGPARMTRSPHRTPTTLLATGGAIVLLGVIVGAVWAVLTPAMTAERVAEGATVQPQEFGNEFAGVMMFALLMCVFGGVAAVVTWVAARGWRGLPGYGLLLGSVVAGSALAGVVGRWIPISRFADPAHVALGQSFRLVPELWLAGDTRGGPPGPWILGICAPLAATLVYLICVLLTRDPDLGVGDGPDDHVD